MSYSETRDIDELQEELLQRVDSLYAEFGPTVTHGDIEEQINDVFYEPE